MPGYARTPAIERWARKVERRGPDECWPWRGAVRKGNLPYGHLLGDNRRHVYAHRLSYEHHHGPIPAGLELRHTCHDTLCVNPRHLIVGTHAENVQDTVRAGRHFHGPRPHKRGEMASHARLTNAQAAAIRRDRRTLREIAAEYDVSLSVISRVRRGQTYAVAEGV